MTPQASRRGWRFWLITLAAVAGICATLALGRWQLARAAQKEALQDAIAARGAQPPLDTSAFIAGLRAHAADALVHRRVQLRGRWLAGHTVYLDNRQMQGRPGFFVVTPLRLAGGDGAWVLVQRGWIARDFQDRTRLQPVQTPGGEVAVDGRVAPPPSKMFDVGAAGSAAGEGSSHIRQNLDLGAFGAEIHASLAPVSVVQTGAPGEGLLRDWTGIGSGAEKHYGYAFQWFGLSGLIAFLYVWFQIVRRLWPARQQPAS